MILLKFSKILIKNSIQGNKMHLNNLEFYRNAGLNIN